MENQQLYIYKTATAKGRWGTIVVIARSAKQKQAAERSLATAPIFENLLCFLIAARNIPSIKNTSGFRGFSFGLAKPEQLTG